MSNSPPLPNLNRGKRVFRNLSHLEYAELPPDDLRHLRNPAEPLLPVLQDDLYFLDESTSETTSSEKTSSERSCQEAASSVSIPNVSSPESVVGAMVNAGLNADALFIDELTIYHHRTTNPLDNRWAFSSDVIDYARIDNWIRPIDLRELIQLKKLKITGLPWREMLYLLRSLPETQTLEQLDIDQFEIAFWRIQFCDLPSLRTLSIRSFKEIRTDEMKEDRADLKTGDTLLQVNAPNLNQLYLDTFDYIKLSNPEKVTHLIANHLNDPTDTNKKLRFPQFSGLTTVELNNIRNDPNHFETVIEFARRETAPALTSVHCNTNSFDDVTDLFSAFPEVLKKLYARLRFESSGIDTKEVSIYFSGIKLDLWNRRQFFNEPSKALCVLHRDLPNSRVASACLQVAQCNYLTIQRNFRPSNWPRLFSLYPNIRAVFAQFKKYPGQINRDQFLAFLKGLNCLVELDLRRSGLPVDFYAQLSSAQYTNGRALGETLNAFTLLELVESPACADLEFLVHKEGSKMKYPHLRRLHTNHPGKLQLGLLLDNTLNWPVFEWAFDFMQRKSRPARPSPGSVDQTCYRWTVKKLVNQRPKASYELIFDQVNFNSNNSVIWVGKDPDLPTKYTFDDILTLQAYIIEHKEDGSKLGPVQ